MILRHSVRLNAHDFITRDTWLINSDFFLKFKIFEIPYLWLRNIFDESNRLKLKLNQRVLFQVVYRYSRVYFFILSPTNNYIWLATKLNLLLFIKNSHYQGRPGRYLGHFEEFHILSQKIKFYKKNVKNPIFNPWTHVFGGCSRHQGGLI